MINNNVMSACFMEVRILGKPALFIPIRIDKSTIPNGYYMYEIRDDNGVAIEITHFVVCNYWGTIITLDEITLIDKFDFKDGLYSYLSIQPNDLIYGVGNCHSMQDFMIKYSC